MDATDPRAALDALIRDNGEDYASLSKMLGRNPAYVQQFIKRGSPRRLSEEDRRLLARYFRVAESVLGGPTEKPVRVTARGLVRVPCVAVDASAGPGALAGEEREVGALGFDPLWLKRRGLDPAMLSVISVVGDSMVPTLGDGDDILVDRSDAASRLRDGIYVLRIDDALWVKRIAMNPAGRRFTIRSDNPSYPGWPDCDPADIAVIGRVVWFGRRLV
jgi:phage repressor protein C with HTH and peptisase S24 domain